MSFIWPWVLVSLLAMPVCVLAYVRLQRRRSRHKASLGAVRVVGEGTATSAGHRRHIPPAIFLIGAAILALASARPQLTLPLPRMEGTVLLAFDVSASMGADDVEPTRMDAAKQIAKMLIDRRPSSARMGIVTFGESGLVVQPPTDDDEVLGATIDRLVPQSGTSLGWGILTALNLVSPAPNLGSEDTRAVDGVKSRGTFEPAVIVLLTDGENTDPPDPLEAAQTAIDRGVRVHTVGLGTTEGTVVEVDGFNVHTQLNESVLQEMALLTEGVYFGIEDMENVTSVYERLETEFVVESREIEITSALGGVSALLLLAGSTLSLFWFGRVP